MATIPSTMRSLVALKYCWPKEWEVADMPVPTIEDPKDILVKMHAGAIMTGDTQLARGAARFLLGGLKLPHKIGIEGAGIIAKVGPGVTQFKPGDAVYIFGQSRPMNMTAEKGYCSQYAVARENLTLHKPANVSFEEICSLASVITAIQTIEMGLRLMRQNGVTDGLEGKTVFVPGALSATGSVAIQVLRNVYGVGRIMATVSTAKIPLVEQHLPGLVDQVVDYTRTPQLTDAIPAGSVDFVFNTQWQVTDLFALLKPDVGVVASIASIPSPELLHKMLPPLPFFVYWFAGLGQMWYSWKSRGTNIKHEFHSGNIGQREDLERAGEVVALGKVKSVMRVVDLEDIETIRTEAQKVATGKGGVGKLIIKIP
ncbi:GroES-like protein [Hypomontagnella monticulosa]|nr:GroES-like protein [Hypomontagnella monticulosa]